MRHLKLAFLGFGNVGKALARLFLDKQKELGETYQITFSATGIATSRHGTAIDPGGLDLNRVLQVADLSTMSRQPVENSALDFIQNCQADVLFENTPVNYATGQPAVDHLRAALDAGMHAITANKGPVVHAYHELSALARQKDRKFYFESTVMDGAPIFSLFRETLPGAKLLSFHGILNSTTNMILTLMEQGKSFNEAVDYCQKTGIAETDPSGDIDGWDAAVKIAALSTVLMDIPLKPSQVDRQGIRGLTSHSVIDALKEWQTLETGLFGETVRENCGCQGRSRAGGYEFNPVQCQRYYQHRPIQNRCPWNPCQLWNWIQGQPPLLMDCSPIF